ncbi:MAG: VanZ family protein [Ignavibacteria bacterium]|nr:VanZ family protein [Ignavibacteria bacterium]
MTLRIILTAQFIALSALIYWLSDIPNLVPPYLGFDLSDKVIHALAFFTYGISSQLAVLGWMPNAVTGLRVTVSTSIAVMYAATDEAHQLMVPGRTGALDDFVADCIGIALSLLLRSILGKIILRFHRG